MPPALVQVQNHCPLARISRQSCLKSNNEGDNELILGADHRSPSICLSAEEKPRKPLLGDPVMKAVRPVIASNRVSYLQITLVGWHNSSGRENERKKERAEIILGL